MKYTPTIGIECHVQLKTKTKLFAAVDNDAHDQNPNELVSHICLGMPGAMPYLNKVAIELACKAGYALGVTPQKFSKFDRKHYFYPDLPKGYQISQFNYPIVLGGKVEITVEGESKQIGITRAHLEEDAGKTTHPAGKDYSLVDLNRAGTPLLEIVSEPEIHSSKDAKAFAQKLLLLMKYSGISDASLYHGNMRFDVNVSLSTDPKKLGTRSETKNLNSFKSVERAVEFEIRRQTELLEKGMEVIQETRGWDDAKQKTISQRGKEKSHDYRYFPDPDIPPLELTDSFLADIKTEFNRRNLAVIVDNLKKQASLSEDGLSTLLSEPDSVDLALKFIEKKTDNKTLSIIMNWLINIVPTVDADISSFSKNQIDGILVLAKATADQKLISTNAKQGLVSLLTEKDFDAQSFIGSNLTMDDESELEQIVENVLKSNPNAVSDIQKGEMKAIGYLVGQVMKESKGKANPTKVQEMIKKQLRV